MTSVADLISTVRLLGYFGGVAQPVTSDSGLRVGFNPCNDPSQPKYIRLGSGLAWPFFFGTILDLIT